jgi:hypothetical protein
MSGSFHQIICLFLLLTSTKSIFCFFFKTQITAVGTLLNVVGSALDTAEEREQLRQLLTDGLVLGALRSSVFEETEST